MPFSIYAVKGIQIDQVFLFGLFDVAGLGKENRSINNFFNYPYPLHHTAKHLVRSSLSEISGNLLSGKGPFNNFSGGLNLSAIAPATGDALNLTSKYWGNPVKNLFIRKYFKKELTWAKENDISVETKGNIEFADPYIGRWGMGGAVAFDQVPELILAKDFTGPGKGAIDVFGLKIPDIWSAAITNPGLSKVNFWAHNFGQPKIGFFGFHDAYYMAVRLGAGL